MLGYLSWTLLAALVAPSVAQTYTSCDPTKISCPDDPALGTAYTWNMTNSTLDTTNGVWNLTGPGVTQTTSTAMFSMKQKGDAPTIQSNFYIFWGSVSVIMKAAKGQGVVSAVTLQSDDLDEIDWEWIGSDNAHVQTNYYGKGNHDTYDRGTIVEVSNPQDEWHNYTTTWTQDQLQWIIDGQVVRTLKFAESQGNGSFYPQTPMDLRLGVWSGGDSESNGTVQWAGGPTDWSQAPFNMEISNVYVNDGQRNVSAYSYGDNTGDFKSIKMKTGKSSIADSISQPPQESVTQKFNNLSTGAKIGIFASVGGVLAILIAVFCCCCIRQRKAGRRERALADAEWDKSSAELMAYRNQMAKGGFGHGNTPVSPNPQYAPQHKF